MFGCRLLWHWVAVSLRRPAAPTLRVLEVSCIWLTVCVTPILASPPSNFVPASRTYSVRPPPTWRQTRSVRVSSDITFTEYQLLPGVESVSRVEERVTGTRISPDGVLTTYYRTVRPDLEDAERSVRVGRSPPPARSLDPAEEQVYLWSYRGYQSTQYHKSRCRALLGMISAIKRKDVGAGIRPCPGCFHTRGWVEDPHDMFSATWQAEKAAAEAEAAREAEERRLQSERDEAERRIQERRAARARRDQDLREAVAQAQAQAQARAQQQAAPAAPEPVAGTGTSEEPPLSSRERELKAINQNLLDEWVRKCNDPFLRGEQKEMACYAMQKMLRNFRNSDQRHLRQIAAEWDSSH